MKILYMGPLRYGETCLQRMIALKELGNQIFPIDTKSRLDRHKLGYNIFSIIIKKLFNKQIINEKIKSYLLKGNFDLLWIDKGIFVEARTLKKIRLYKPKVKIIGYSPDDMGRKHNQTRDFLESLPFYDLYITTKSYNVQELKDLGCKKVIFIDNSYDSGIHKPIKISGEDKINLGGGVGFIGEYEKERADYILFLANNGIPVRVWGEGWKKNLKYHSLRLKIEGKSLWGKEYTRAICSFDINLCFLRKINRDLQTTRSIEIPACGGFMLAERTSEHLRLFKEGKEAEFFASKQELLEKIRYYLTHKRQREEIAEYGRKRCVTQRYSNYERLKKILKFIEKNEN